MIPPYSRFHYYQLNKREKQIYEKIVYGFERLQPSISLGRCDSSIDYLLILRYVILDNPELFFVSSSQAQLRFCGNGDVILQGVFLYSCEEVKRLRARLERRVGEITRGVNGSFEERIAALHRRLLKNLVYSKNEGPDQYTAVGALLNGRAVCKGIALAFKLLCDYLRIPAITVHGTACHVDGEELHSWNIVRDESTGRNYHVDATYDLGMPEEFNTLYLLAGDALIRRNHRADGAVYPRCLYQGTYEKSAVDVNSEAQLTAALKQRGAVLLRFSEDMRPEDSRAFGRLFHRCTSAAGHTQSYIYTYVESLGCAVIKSV